jgi:alpha-mannosidase
LPSRFSLASVTDSGVVVETAKWAEDEDALILRLYEADGGVVPTASLALGVTPEGVDQVDLLERNPRPLAVSPPNEAVSLAFRAREIKTIRIRVAN